MSRREIYKISTLKVDEDPALGFYEPSPEIYGQMIALFEKIPLDGKKATLPIPNIDGAELEVRRIGDGLEMAATVQTPAQHPGPHVVVFLALDVESAKASCRRALELVYHFGWPEIGINPKWGRAMLEHREVPFTVIVPNFSAMESIAASEQALDDFRLSTGFFQSFIGAVLKRMGVPSLSSTEAWLQREAQEQAREDGELPDGVDFAAAIQTEGEPHDKLIVSRGSDYYPEVYAHIVDLEVDVFTVAFEIDGTMNIDTANLSYLMVEDDTLQRLLALSEEAQDIWARVQGIIDEVGNPHETNWDQMETDPLAHLYTQHKPVNVPDHIARSMQDMGIAEPRRGEEED